MQVWRRARSKRTWGRRCAASCGLGNSFWMCTKFGQAVVGACRPNLIGPASRKLLSRFETRYGKLASDLAICAVVASCCIWSTHMLIMLDVGHLSGVGIMSLPMGVPFVIATHASARRVVFVLRVSIHWSMMPFCNASRTPWHATGGINVVVVGDACRSTLFSTKRCHEHRTGCLT